MKRIDHPHSIDELVSNPDFRNWALEQDPSQNAYWENLISKDQLTKERIFQAKLLVLTLNRPKVEFNTEDENILWDRVQSSIELQQENENKVIHINPYPDGSENKTNYKFSMWWRILVASVAVFLITYFSMEFQNQSEPVDQPVAMIEKKVAKGQKLKLYLPDGSKVALNSQSKIVYPEKFEGNFREVEIEGEVYFEVMKDSLKPFIVKSKDMITEVLGTSFNVNSYPGSVNSTVSLLEGKVKVSLVNPEENRKIEEALTIDPGEEITFHTPSGVLSKGQILNKYKLQWVDGVLAFNREKLPDVFNKLEMWYGVRFVFNRSLPRDKVLTGKFTNEYLDNVLQSINYTVTFDYEIDGDTVYVNFKN